MFYACVCVVQIVKKERKSYIINISKEYSIVSQFTSFVAIEEREKVREDPRPYCTHIYLTTHCREWLCCTCSMLGWLLSSWSGCHSVEVVATVLVVWLQDEKFDPLRGPSISDLVAKETVDKLTYMGWELDQASDPKKVLYHLTVCVC